MNWKVAVLLLLALMIPPIGEAIASEDGVSIVAVRPIESTQSAATEKREHAADALADDKVQHAEPAASNIELPPGGEIALPNHPDRTSSILPKTFSALSKWGLVAVALLILPAMVFAMRSLGKRSDGGTDTLLR